MSEVKYQFSIANDTLNGKASSDKLHMEISFSTIATALARVDVLESIDKIDTYFVDNLTTEEIATLGSVLGSHDGEVLLDAAPKTQDLPFASKVLDDGSKIYKRVHGVSGIEIAPGETELIDIEIDYAHAKIEAMEIVGAGEQHTCDFTVCDTDENTYSGLPTSEPYGANFPLNQFGFGVNVAKDFYRFHSRYDADLFLSMVVEVSITNNSTETSNVSFNIELNEVVS